MDNKSKNNAWFAIGTFGGSVDRELLDKVCEIINEKYDDDYMQGLLTRILESGLL